MGLYDGIRVAIYKLLLIMKLGVGWGEEYKSNHSIFIAIIVSSIAKYLPVLSILHSSVLFLYAVICMSQEKILRLIRPYNLILILNTIQVC